MNDYVLFLRGINVGGRHKLPMADLKAILIGEGASFVQTLQNAGNAVIVWELDDLAKKEEELARLLEKKFGFAVPVMIRSGQRIRDLIRMNPFPDQEPSADFHYLVSFLKDAAPEEVQQACVFPEAGFSILEVNDREVFSIIERHRKTSPDAMTILEKRFGKAITTRNWHTVLKMASALKDL